MPSADAPIPFTWPVDPETGEPMAIVTAAVSNLVPTVPFGNVTLGPVGVMVPCKNDPEVIQQTQIEQQRAAQFVIGQERRLVQWAIDPTAKVQTPAEINTEVAEAKTKE